jgi:hypothetical protein
LLPLEGEKVVSERKPGIYGFPLLGMKYKEMRGVSLGNY